MISIIIPFFNKSKTIHLTLSSVFNAYNAMKKKHEPIDFEVIIINDGSSHCQKLELSNIVSHFSYYDILLIDQNNAGVSAARNRGLSIAKYDYIYFLDADDTVLPNFFCFFDFIKDNKCVSGFFFNLKINNKILKHGLNNGFLVDESVFCSLFSSRVLHLSNLIIKRESLIEFNDEIKVGEDLLFIYDNIIEKEIIFLDNVIATYNYDGKFYNNGINGLELIKLRVKDAEFKEVLYKAINEKNYLLNCFYRNNLPVNNEVLSYKIFFLGMSKSAFIYSIIQKLRFFL